MPRPELKPLDLDDEAWEEMAMSVTPQEIAAAQQAFREGTNPDARELLDATEQESTS